SDLVEPLDFWWAPFGSWMALAYALIIGGGVLITRRLHLLEMAVVFWVMLAAGLGVLSASGHCMIATWSPTPVCDARFWGSLVTSPEILVFLFFMITDPRTIPSGRTARVAFAATLGIFATLMIAPHTVEYGAKVGLLASLALWSPLRGLFDRMLTSTTEERSGVGSLLNTVGGLPTKTGLATGAITGVVAVAVAMAIVAAGAPARVPAIAAEQPDADFEASVDPATLPEVTVDESVSGLQIEVDEEFIDFIAMTLAENLAIEAEAMRTADGSLLGLADGGLRLDQMQARLDTAIATGERPADEYSFESLTLSAHEREGQASAGLMFSGRGMVDRVLYDAFGSELSRTPDTFEAEFVLLQLVERWVIVEVDEG
ncbi:MAG TPA: hypothetical protein VJ858_00760, partial [Acidimicrobiia bacterium]|nr:hypothetical protein [Acidimicrobiia bacterium]